MNKIKPQVSPYDSFSPWEESFINLVRSFDPSKSPLKRQYLTLDACKGHEHPKATPSRKQFGRSILNLSKINLRSSPSDKEQELIIQQRSTRYQGPRITFYSKMNPNCSERSRSNLSGESKSLRYSFYDNNRTTIIRDGSIKYLDILDDNNQTDKSKETYAYFRSIFPTKVDKKDFIIPRKREEGFHNMRRLKILANNRKLSQLH